MTTLTEFLLARIAEDEGEARAAQDDAPTPWVAERLMPTITDCTYLQDADGIPLLDSDGYAGSGEDVVVRHIARHDPARVLAECEAKRRIVGLHPIYRGPRIHPIDTSGTDFGCELCHRLDAIHSDSLIEAVGYCDTLLALSLPYADHPDHDESWRP